MKIKLLSDLHMEGRKFYYEWHGEDVVFLAGDIHTKNRHEELIEQIPQWVEIYMVPGNHEYYDGDFDEVNTFLTGLQKQFDNFTFLNNKAAWLKDGTAVFGGTMFTDFTLDGIGEQWFARHHAARGIADFGLIGRGNRNWTTADHEEQHAIFCKELQLWKKHTEGKRRIVMTHFMPTAIGTPAIYMNSSLNPYFTQNMHQYMPGIDYWFCGHGHDPRDVNIAGTRVLMNPRGYRGENEYGFRPECTIEIGE